VFSATIFVFFSISTMKKGLLPCEKNCLFFAAPLDGRACSMVKYYGNSMSKKEHENANGKGPGSGGCDLHTKDVKRFAKATES
jgi:hypothetical protein